MSSCPFILMTVVALRPISLCGVLETAWPLCRHLLFLGRQSVNSNLCQNSGFQLQMNLTYDAYDITYVYSEIKCRLSGVASVLVNQTGLLVCC